MPSPITIRKALYLPAAEGVTTWVKQRYLGPGLRLEEERKDQRLAGDFHENIRRRYSDDNGRTWSDWEPEPDPPMKDGYTLIRWLFASAFDPASGVTLEARLHRLSRGARNEGVEAWWQSQTKAYADHMFIQHTADAGRTRSPMQQIQLTPAPSFNESDWADAGFFNSNEMYGGYDFAFNRAGQAVYPLSLPGVTHRNDDGSTESVFGIRCVLGSWNPSTRSYTWTPGATTLTVSHRISGRGLDEPAVVALRNGDLLMCMRGTNVCDGADPWRGTVESPGRAWCSVSKDGGSTWGLIFDLRFDTGETFYVPSSMSRFIRSSRNGTLYWLGNIPRTRPYGDNPRYPLVIAQVDEAGGPEPTLKKATVTPIEDRDEANQFERVGLSNFSILENRETGEIELIFPHFLERGILPDGQPDFACKVWKYWIDVGGR